MYNVKISTKLTLAFLAMTVFVLILGGVSLYSLQKVENESQVTAVQVVP
ncbi:MCP four helix bundle domain-containing protein, partial [Glaesserella parasuis]